MNTRELIIDSFKKLEAESKQILSDCGWDGKEYYSHPSEIDYLRFRTEAMNLIRRSCGETSDHYQQLKRLAEDKRSGTNSYYFIHCLGVLEAAHRDFDAGLLFDLRALVA
ncbi:MAG: hypothetical protein QQN41_13520, partial [Nitrosopumilus sp.]